MTKKLQKSWRKHKTNLIKGVSLTGLVALLGSLTEIYDLHTQNREKTSNTAIWTQIHENQNKLETLEQKVAILEGELQNSDNKGSFQNASNIGSNSVSKLN